MKYSELLRQLERAGWQKKRQKGSHIVMVHSDETKKPLIMPFHGSKEIGEGLKTKILKQAGLS